MIIALVALVAMIAKNAILPVHNLNYFKRVPKAHLIRTLTKV
jgi:hypothetical protein